MTCPLVHTGSPAALPLRRHRRGVRARLRRQHPIRTGAIQEPRPAASDRDPAAKDCRYRRLHRCGPLRSQRRRIELGGSDPHHRRVSRAQIPIPRNRRYTHVTRVISPTDIHDRARKLWATGQPLRALLWTLPNQPAPLSGLGTMQRVQPFFPCLVPFRKPTAQEWLDHFADLRAAAAALEAQSKGALGAGDTITFRETAHQKLGRLRVPERITFECIEDLAVCAGESDTVRRFRNIVRVLEEREPRLLQWLADRPSTALEVEPDLVRLLDAAAHFQAHPRPNRYARELGILGVDSKFIEGSRARLSEWFDRLLPADAIDGTIRGLADHGFERRYGLRFEEPQIRFRWLDTGRALLGL